MKIYKSKKNQKKIRLNSLKQKLSAVTKRNTLKLLFNKINVAKRTHRLGVILTKSAKTTLKRTLAIW